MDGDIPSVASLFKDERGVEEEFEVRIEHLDYRFAEECKDARQLHAILDELKTGKHGRFPELEQFVEKRMLEEMPEEQRRKYMALTRDATYTERKAAEAELADWLSKIGSGGSDAKDVFVEKKLPPVRGTSHIPVRGSAKPPPASSAPPVAKPSTKPARKEPKAAPLKEYYERWDKIEKAVEDDEEEEEEGGGGEEEKEEEKGGVGVGGVEKKEEEIGVGEMSAAMKVREAERERIKGNEAFRAGDDASALAHYTRALELDSSLLNVLSNRALVNLRLKRFAAAEGDATGVLRVDPNHVKCLYRRASARMSRGLFREALGDVNALLKLEPKNAKAKELQLDIKRKGRTGRVWTEEEEKEWWGSVRKVKEEKPVEEDDEEDGVVVDGDGGRAGGATKVAIMEDDSSDEECDGEDEKEKGGFTKLTIEEDDSSDEEEEEEEEVKEVKKKVVAVSKEAEAKKDEGNRLFAESKLEEALVAWKKALRLDRRLLSAYSNRALAFLRLGRIEMAKEEVVVGLKAVEEVWGGVGSEEVKKDEVKKGVVYKLFHRLGLAHKANGDWEDAEKAFEQAVKIQGNGDPGGKAFSELVIARRTLRQKRKESGRKKKVVEEVKVVEKKTPSTTPTSVRSTEEKKKTKVVVEEVEESVGGGGSGGGGSSGIEESSRSTSSSTSSSASAPIPTPSHPPTPPSRPGGSAAAVDEAAAAAVAATSPSEKVPPVPKSSVQFERVLSSLSPPIALRYVMQLKSTKLKSLYSKRDVEPDVIANIASVLAAASPAQAKKASLHLASLSKAQGFAMASLMLSSTTKERVKQVAVAANTTETIFPLYGIKK